VVDTSCLKDVREAAASARGLGLLVLHGSRARGDDHERSDWDFGYEADASFDPDALLATLVERLACDRIDLADLNRAGALLRFRVARDGSAVFEREAGAFDRFRLEAVHTWCDMQPVLERAYNQVLEDVRE
jgi:predicted nucleotidyltransferase